MDQTSEPAQGLFHILLVGDAVLVRAGFRLLVQSLFPRAVVEEIGSTDALSAAIHQRPHVIIHDVDQSQVNMFDLWRVLRIQNPRLPIIALTSNQDPLFLQQLSAGGASAVVPKQRSPQDFRSVIEQVIVALDPPPIPSMVTAAEEEPTSEVLTPSEKQIVLAIGMAFKNKKGYENKQIAKDLSMSEAALQHHLSALFSKLGVADRLELLIYAQRHGLIDDI